MSGRKQGEMRPRGIDWDDQPLGEVPDSVLSKKLGVSMQAVWLARTHRNIEKMSVIVDWDNQPLGDGPDDVLAHRLGVSVSAVCKARLRRGIPDGGVRSTDWAKVPLGEVPDGDIAELTGRALGTVAFVRKRLGVRRFEYERTCPCGKTFKSVKKEAEFCCNECQKAVYKVRKRWPGVGEPMDKIAACLAKFRREVEARR